MMNSEEGRSKGFGFVSFEEAEQVKALNKFSDSKLSLFRLQ